MTFRMDVSTGLVGLQGSPIVGLRKFGVPPGGAFDAESAHIANALLGNRSELPVLELAMVNATVKFDSEVTISIVGGGHDVSLDGARIELGSTFRATPNSVLKIRPNTMGLRCYLAAPGGLVRSKGDRLGFVSERAGPRPLRRFSEPLLSLDHGPLRVVGESFDIEHAVVTARIDRVGLRLEADGMRNGVQSAVSRPVVYGAVQRAPSGELLIHGPDGPTIGGYDLLGVIARIDHDRLGQLRPGQLVTFLRIGLEEARELWSRSLALRASRIEALGPFA